MNRSKQIAKKGIKLNAFINIEYCYIWLGIVSPPRFSVKEPAKAVSISLFAGFLEKETSLETLIVIFEKVSPKGFFLTEYEEFRNFRFDGKFSIFTDSGS